MLKRITFIALVGMAVGAMAWASVELTREFDRIAAIWLGNGFLVAMLLTRARTEWLPLVACAWAANLTVNFYAGDTAPLAIGLSLTNSLEVLIAASTLHGTITTPRDLVNGRVLWSFFARGVVFATAVGAAMGAAVVVWASGAVWPSTFLRWWAADALGMAVMVPLIFAASPRELRIHLRGLQPMDVIAPFAVLIATAMLVFGQSKYPLLFLLMPSLLVISFRLGLAASAIGVFLILAFALGYTLAGIGPLMLVQGAMAPRIFSLQLLIATLVLTAYPVCALMSSQRRLLQKVADSEQRQRVIAENSSDIIALTDVNGVWTYMSPAVETMFGWKISELLGRNGADFAHEDDRIAYGYGTSLLAGGREVLAGSFRMRHKQGHHLWVETISRVLRDHDGKVIGWVSNTRDISARKQVEQLKSEFISTVSHELRTPLTAMLGSIGLAASGRFDDRADEMRRLLDIAKTNGRRLEALVNDILDFEKLTSGNMRFDMQSYSTDELVEQSVAASQPYADGLRVKLVFSHRAPGTRIRVDNGRFQQIMANLLSNAAKFSNEGGRVEIDVAVIKGRCRISVADQGCGIPKEFHDNLFERFSQADGSDSRKRGGTGLGMAIAKQMTDRMQGSIRFESEEGTGTTFYLEFPVAEAQTHAA